MNERKLARILRQVEEADEKERQDLLAGAPQEVQEAYQTARRLAGVDYSRQSWIRDALEARLLSVDGSEERPEGRFTAWLSPTARVILWGAAALLLALFLIWALNTLIPSRVPAVSGSPTASPASVSPTAPAVSSSPTAPAVIASSPGPGKLAYVQGGDIWVKDLPDGQPEPLTEDGANSRPRWSPSGNWLAYMHGEGQLRVVSDNGDQQIELPGSVSPGAFAWSPAADRLAYVEGEGDLMLVEPGGQPQTLVPSPERQPQTLVPSPERQTIPYLAWGPDGAWIAYQWQAPPLNPPPPDMGLSKVSPEGGEPLELYAETGETAGPGVSRLAGWTADGSGLVFWGGSQYASASLGADGLPLMLLPAEGGQPQGLVQSVLAYPDYVSADPAGGQGLAVVVGGGREAWSGKILYRFSGQDSAPLTTPEFAVASPAWSPDGRRLAYIQMPAASDLAGGEPARQALMQRRLWVMDITNGDARQLTDAPAYRDEFPMWSQDGSSLLFVRLDEADRASLWRLSLLDGEPQPVIDDLDLPEGGWFGYYGHVDWPNTFDWWRGRVSKPDQLPDDTP